MEEATASMAAAKVEAAQARKAEAEARAQLRRRVDSATQEAEEKMSRARARAESAELEMNRIVRQLNLTRTELTTAREMFERDRQARIEHLAEVALRRMRSRTLAQGWTNWLAPYRLGNQRKRILQFASRSLLKPRQSFAFNHWRWDWKATLARQARDARAEALLIERAEVASANAMRAQRRIASWQRMRSVSRRNFNRLSKPSLMPRQEVLPSARTKVVIGCAIGEESENERLAQSLEVMAASEAEGSSWQTQGREYGTKRKRKISAAVIGSRGRERGRPRACRGEGEAR